jgi:uncharacterized membrane-anchored protein
LSNSQTLSIQIVIFTSTKVGEFMERRLAPAMHTCAAVAAREDALSRRIANTNDLLRPRVEIVQELQNLKRLQSLNARAAQQLLGYFDRITRLSKVQLVCQHNI